MRTEDRANKMWGNPAESAIYTFSTNGDESEGGEKDGRVLEVPNAMWKDHNIVDGGSVCEIIDWIVRTLKVDVIEILFQPRLCTT